MKDVILFVLSCIASFGIGYYIAKRFNKYVNISYLALSNLVLPSLGENSAAGITIEHHGEPIRNLVQTKIALWNSGTEPVSAADVQQSEPLTLHFDGARVLELVGPRGSRTAVAPTAKKASDTIVSVSLQLLNKGDAIVLTVYSEAESDDSSLILPLGRLTGAVKGLAGEPNRIVEFPRDRKVSKAAAVVTIAVALFGFAVLARSIVAFTPYEPLTHPYLDEINVSGWAGVLTATAAFAFGAMFVFGAISEAARALRARAQKPPEFVYCELLG
jgi:hypothetical protein